MISFLQVGSGAGDKLPAGGSWRCWSTSCMWVLVLVFSVLQVSPVAIGQLPAGGSWHFWSTSCARILALGVYYLQVGPGTEGKLPQVCHGAGGQHPAGGSLR